MSMFDFLRSKKIADEVPERALNNQIAIDFTDGAVTVDNPVNSFVMNFDWAANSQSELLAKYREVANYNEVDYAIQDIINEMVSFGEDDDPIELDLTDVELSDAIKEKVMAAWVKIFDMLALKDTIHQRAYNFYVDGRLAYQKVVDSKNIKRGLLNVIELNPSFVTKIRNVQYNPDNRTIDSIEEHFLYDEKADERETSKGGSGINSNKQFRPALVLAKESVTYVTSGLIDPKTGYAISWLHKAIKPANQLRMMENALVIYRISRAPERRVFYIDVGNLPKSKAEQYLQNLKNSFRNRMSYDPESGNFKDQRHLTTMQEDFWLPRTTSGKGTEVSTLPGGTSLGEIDDILYFLKRLYKALNVPTSRLDQDSQLSFGNQDTQINRDELKFSKFVSKVRKRFNMMLRDLLRTELILTNIIKDTEWPAIEQNLKFVYAQDMYLEERKEFEMMRDRISLAEEMAPYIGRYYSNEYIRTKILRQTDEEIAENDKAIKAEKSVPQYQPPVDDDGNPIQN
ncbi:hypothetical protein pf16_111 [Pseudomonas phage pf16]|uniref:Portal protein n=1 Tax=Pseudomonas phage pf16 TaxID=1815630 RepID=A0A1S5R3Z2_9CAUD|nr:portal protein [Pseudomonas phage pf16]AND75034.1 hypothetical protein pf16_111 [Pseudomonas phage pf16]